MTIFYNIGSAKSYLFFLSGNNLLEMKSRKLSINKDYLLDFCTLLRLTGILPPLIMFLFLSRCLQFHVM